MAGLDTLCYCISLLTAGCLAHLFPISTAHDRPVHLIALALTACSFALPGISKALPRLFHPAESRHEDYTALPLDDLGYVNRKPDPAETPSTHPRHNGKVRISVLVAAVSVVCVRLELYRRISMATECTIDSIEVFLPFLLAVYDAVRSQRARRLQEEERPDSSAYDALRATLRAHVLRPRTRYLIPMFLVSYGCYRILYLWDPVTSTYICPLVTGEGRIVPAMQVAALVLDLCLVITVYESSPKQDGKGLSPRRCVVLWSTVMIATAIVWSVVGVIVYIYMPEHRAWLSLLEPPLNFGDLMAITGHVLLFCLLCISSLHCIMVYGVAEMSLHLTAVMTMIPGLEFIWLHKSPFPPIPAFATTLSFFLVFFGRWSYHRIQQALGERDRSKPSRHMLLFIFLCVLLFPAWSKKSYVHFHPIDLLIYDAKIHHEEYLKALGNTTSLSETVTQYKQKYNRNPPPGFDVWFEYAKNRSALIVDEFDQIYEDLLPFRAIPPADLRRQTWEMVSNPWNEISGITIRSGKALVQENVLPTHRWMLEGVAVLINSFAQYLPDMDLAFNLNDESRVAVPYNDITFLREKGRSADESGRSGWSQDRAAGWLPIPEHEFTQTVFRDMSFRNTFRQYGSVGCSPSSLARRAPHISSHSHICGSCVRPHSIGQFVANWSDAADVCHQPDMADLHGFYLSPAAFKTSHQLMPVFSQSKPHGYNDILYPSAWNYMDKVVYAPSEEKGTRGQDDYHSSFPDLPFEQKENTLFWRGATSEGVSSGNGVWRGMTRQRLVHMANNITTSSHDRFTILLPNPSDHKKYKYQVLPGPAVKELGLKPDIAIVDRIARCGGVDCHDQESEVHLVPPTDFQAHWRYRYLFDLDGAGFSGRFLPFLQSRSVPFKTALFREWYDSRLTAWLHFVPQDSRLHGVWSTLAYFAGVNGTMFGQSIWWKPHLREAEIIAEAGREWAGKVLRKDDMELYFFRLLLEWGRLTDDRRDELGFDL
ncbi:hypothetical protein A1O1_05539 [Capronia coronata CBS 617.96]|uniref:Glycosyl transferase CAP10 domain-containing protein n=1 Tax=Capronia coronata CBS 617.96 TaxID=1182541 RepID=W9Z272_9EURO|nr:uncharacterized protein A1O1_05539 [Capronia coronata CBS 617.96]EXJ88609.1 hypothetical protein A1O1_05539 [Capronia coronata CBS 617.96]